MHSAMLIGRLGNSGERMVVKDTDWVETDDACMAHGGRGFSTTEVAILPWPGAGEKVDTFFRVGTKGSAPGPVRPIEGKGVPAWQPHRAATQNPNPRKNWYARVILL